MRDAKTVWLGQVCEQRSAAEKQQDCTKSAIDLVELFGRQQTENHCFLMEFKVFD